MHNYFFFGFVLFVIFFTGKLALKVYIVPPFSFCTVYSLKSPGLVSLWMRKLFSFVVVDVL